MSNKSFTEKPVSKKQLKVLSIVLLFIFSFMFYVCASVFFEELGNIEKIRNSYIYIGNRDFAFGAIFFIPVLTILDYMFILVLLDKFKDTLMKLFVKITIVSIPLMIITSITYSFWIGSELRANGYSHCTWYDSPTRGTPVVWVKSDRYCQERAVLIEYDLLKQLDHYDNIGKEPSDKQLDLMIVELLEDNPFYRREHGLSDLKRRKPL
ncbi:hypothetical protein A9267_12780 [Shewanella sp. UCD-FRSSP16_17]|uniref:DUF1240 domain-containing protein n=1 Tax=Shewanella sp. UCD-FRSSP16_17 TaxID=1853256 RepID=UPI0007EEEDBB|nr:DUF1240 domain-containing protein [Shewanella sp. UCD-FRSSP16_17]OBT06773.1 hypothetical protein A9267_12780 [Shewanella sp. UCD-FRSSP16_17]